MCVRLYYTSFEHNLNHDKLNIITWTSTFKQFTLRLWFGLCSNPEISMENILNRDVIEDSANARALEQLKYDLNSTNSDSDIDDDEDSRDADLSTEENNRSAAHMRSDALGNDYGIGNSVKQEPMDGEIILPQASQPMNKEKKKEIKSKKELEEEEREKMQ